LLIGIFRLYWLATLFLSANKTTLDNTSSPSHIKRKLRTLLPALAAFVIPILIALALLLWYNMARFGSFLATGYHFESGEGFTTPLGQGVWGLLLSPYRGIFWFTPLFIGTLLAFPAFLRRHPAEGWLLTDLSVGLIGLYSLWWMWWGGYAWGPRFLVPLAPFWVLILAPWVDRLATVQWEFSSRRWRATLPASLRSLGYQGLIVLALALISFVVQLLAVSVNYVNYETYLRSVFPTDWADPLKFGPPAQRLIDWSYSPVLGQWQLLRENFVANTDLAWVRADGDV
jgi:hypothetical protein